MARVKVYEDVGDGRQALAGWYDDNNCDRYEEARDWDGHNQVSVHESGPRAYSRHQALIRTQGGRWVLHRWSDWVGSQPTQRFVDADLARTWLMTNGDDDAVARWWGEPAEESGPGRPEVGGLVNVRLGSQLAAVDAEARRAGVTRAEMVRTLIAEALAARPR